MHNHSKTPLIPANELEYTFIRSPGPGGQNVNKVATAVQLRFNIQQSSLPEHIKTRLIAICGKEEIVIKATRHRTQERNKQDAYERLLTLVQRASFIPKKRKKTKPTYTSIEKRLSKKKRLSKIKSSRKKNLTHQDD